MKEMLLKSGKKLRDFCWEKVASNVVQKPINWELNSVCVKQNFSIKSLNLLCKLV